MCDPSTSNPWSEFVARDPRARLLHKVGLARDPADRSPEPEQHLEQGVLAERFSVSERLISIDAPLVPPLLSMGIRGAKPSKNYCETTSFQEWMDLDTGECGKLTCQRASVCVPCALRKSHKIVRMIHLAGPTWFITIKGLTGDGRKDYHTMRKLFRSVRRDGKTRFEWAYVVEPNRFTTGAHAHVYIRTRQPLNRAGWEKAARSRNLEFHAQRHNSTLGGARYALKKILDADIEYERESMEITNDGIDRNAQQAVEGHLQRNDGRLIHASRGFWLDADGETATMTSLIRGGLTKARRIISFFTSEKKVVLDHLDAEGTSRSDRAP